MSFTVVWVSATRSVGSNSYCLRPCSMREKSSTFSMSDDNRRHSCTMKLKYSFCLLRLRDFAAFQIFGHQPDRGDGRAQFVRDAGDEIGFHLIELLLVAESAVGGNKTNQGRQSRSRDERPEDQLKLALLCVKQVAVGQPDLHDKLRMARHGLKKESFSSAVAPSWVSRFRIIIRRAVTSGIVLPQGCRRTVCRRPVCSRVMAAEPARLPTQEKC